MDVMQSAYRFLNFKETALLKVQNNVHSALNEGSAVILLMLDLSPDFDTIDHQVLLLHLDDNVRIIQTILVR